MDSWWIDGECHFAILNKSTPTGNGAYRQAKKSERSNVQLMAKSTHMDWMCRHWVHFGKRFVLRRLRFINLSQLRLLSHRSTCMDSSIRRKISVDMLTSHSHVFRINNNNVISSTKWAPLNHLVRLIRGGKILKLNFSSSSIRKESVQRSEHRRDLLR